MAQHDNVDQPRQPPAAQEGSVTISPLLLAASGAGITLAGAVLVGGTYIAGTAKRLKEEGIEPGARRAAVPIAARALVVSTAACCLGAGALGWLALNLAGSEGAVQPVLVEGGMQQMANLVRQQRDAIAQEFQQRQHQAAASSAPTATAGTGASDAANSEKQTR